MTRLSIYVNEKVNKQEVDAVLDSTDVLVGAEFEFKMSNHMFDHIKKKYNDDKEKFKKFEKELKTWIHEKGIWRKKYNVVRDKLEKQASNRVEFNSLLNDWMIDYPEPMRPRQPDINIPDNWEDLIDFDYISSTLVNYMQSDSTLSQYIQGDWDIQKDVSLSDFGVELVSPPMTIKEFLVACPNIFDMIDKIGYTDNECGLHIGVSLPGKMNVDVVKLALFTDENYIWKKFDDREKNEYALNMRNKIRQEMYGKKYDKTDNNVRVETLKNMIRTNDIDIKYLSNHYHGVNIEHLDEDEPYIEFRYMGAKEYHKKWQDVKLVVAQYVYNLKLACDPDFKKKEYLLKCTRILNKFETWIILKELEREEEDIRYAAFDPDVNAKSNKKKQGLYIKNLKERLKLLPKLSNEEIKFISSGAR